MLVKTQARIKTLPCAYEPNILHGISFQGWCFPCHNEASGDLTSLTPHLQTLTKFLSQPAPKPFQNSQPELTCPKSGLKVNARLFNFPIRSFVTSCFYIFSLISHKISSLALHGGADNHFTLHLERQNCEWNRNNWNLLFFAQDFPHSNVDLQIQLLLPEKKTRNPHRLETGHILETKPQSWPVPASLFKWHGL